MTGERFYPNEENLGLDCLFWDLGSLVCSFPKTELQGRRSCEGIVDDVCLFLMKGRRPSSLTDSQIKEIRTRAPDLYDKSYLPPGDTE